MGHALQEAGLLLEEAAIAVRPQGLEDADQHVGRIQGPKGVTVDVGALGQRVEVVLEEVVAHLVGKRGLGVVEQRGDVVLQRPAAPALVVDEPGLAVAEHDVAGLEVAVEEVVGVGVEQEVDQRLEVPLQRLLVERGRAPA